MTVLTGDSAFQSAVNQLSAAQAALSAARRSGNQAAAAQAQNALYELNNTIQQRLGVLGGNQTAAGKVLIQDAGEAVIPVSFPVIFVEEPLFSFGGVMDQGQPPLVGNFPTVSAVVLVWELTKFGSIVTYTGAKVGVVTTGDPAHRMYLHWQFNGRAVKNDANTTAPAPQGSMIQALQDEITAGQQELSALEAQGLTSTSTQVIQVEQQIADDQQKLAQAQGAGS